MAGVSSRDAPSLTMTSKSRQVWAASDCSAAASTAWLFIVGTTTDTSGALRRPSVTAVSSAA